MTMQLVPPIYNLMIPMVACPDAATQSSGYQDIYIIVFSAIAVYILYHVVFLVISVRKRKQTGLDGMVGREVVAVQDLEPEGWVSYEGVKWKARLSCGDIARAGDRLVVQDSEGLMLIVYQKRS